LRGAISKKKKELLEEQRLKFTNGAAELGNDKVIAEKLFDLINYFAQYGFNKSHSAAYAMISYQTAFLKANFPVEFMAALLSIRMGSQEKVSLYINECRRMNIFVLPPDINDSYSDFTVFDNSIRFGLSAIKNVGINVIEEIRIERKSNGIFNDFYDFCLRIDNSVLNKKTIESLIKGGAFDTLNHSRKFLLENFEKITEISQKIKKDRIAGQFSLFDNGPDNTYLDYKNEFSEINEYKDEFIPTDLLNFEKEMLGLYITSHPLNEYESALLKVTSISDLADKEDNSVHTIGGIVTRIKSVYTKKNQIMYYVGLEDKTGSLEIVVFPNAVEEYRQIIVTDSILQITGRLDKKEIRTGFGGRGSDFQTQPDDNSTSFGDLESKEQGESEAEETNQSEEIRKNFTLKIVAQKIELLKKVKVKVKQEAYSVETDENELKALNYSSNDSNNGSAGPASENYIKTDKNEIILKVKKDLFTNAFIDELHEIINESKGNTKLNVQVFKTTDNLKIIVEKNFYLPESFNVEYSREFSEKIEKRFGGKILIE
ncbi:MAG: OB-fold nucleic acid binding domain-containing protein, partial [Actinomycetota bacterium]